MEFIDKVLELKYKNKTAEEIAHILDTDAGRVRIVMDGGADPDPDGDDYELVDTPEEEEEEEGPLYGDEYAGEFDEEEE